jgi:glyoxylase-like metal-dependent hydrolase (beta-lactamase superfamily II)
VASSLPATHCGPSFTDVDEVRQGVWHWQAAHPDWKLGEDWGELVSSYAIEDDRRLLLFDPLSLPGELEDRAALRETTIVLTCPWHRRDAVGIADRLNATLYVPPPDEGDSDAVPGIVFRAGDRLPVGVEAFAGFEPNDLVLWVESHRVVVAGDTLIDRGSGLELPGDWLREGVAVEEIQEALRPLLELPVEYVLATHGGPFDRDALESALAEL